MIWANSDPSAMAAPTVWAITSGKKKKKKKTQEPTIVPISVAAGGCRRQPFSDMRHSQFPAKKRRDASSDVICGAGMAGKLTLSTASAINSCTSGWTQISMLITVMIPRFSVPDVSQSVGCCCSVAEQGGSTVTTAVAVSSKSKEALEEESPE